MTQHFALVSRLIAALTHVRAAVAVVFMTLGLALWMLVGVAAAGISALFERKRARRMLASTQDPRVWSLPEWLQA